MTPERQTKHGRIVAYLDAHELDAVALSRRCNFAWYTGGARNYVGTACDVGNSTLIVRRAGAAVLTNNIEGPRLRREDLAGSDIEVVETPWHEAEALVQAARRLAGSARLAADAPLPGLETTALGADFDRLRWSLTGEEIERYRGICNDTVAAVEYICRDASPGTAEHELAGMLAGALLCAGCTPWVLLTADDDRVRNFRHSLPTSKPVTHLFLLATCAERGGLLAACTRLVSFGPLPDDLKRRQDAVATVDAALISATRPGAALGDIFAEGLRAYEAVGFPHEWRHHHQGGSIGYLPREVKAAPGEKTQALAHQAFAWNPSIAGTKSEDTILCADAGPKLLADPTDWPTIPAAWNGFTIPRPAILIRQV